MRLRLDPTSLTGVTSVIGRDSGRFIEATSGGRAQVGTSAPSSAQDGDLFYDTDDTTLYVWASGQWNAISGGGGAPDGAFDFMDGNDFQFMDGTSAAYMSG